MPTGFPVNIAAGALLLVLGGLVMKLQSYPVDYRFGLRLVAFFILGSVLAYFARKMNFK